MFAILCSPSCSPSNSNIAAKISPQNSLLKLEMFLNAFGVESDGYPYIQASIDFNTHTSSCNVWYDNPKFKATKYSLKSKEIDSIRILLMKNNLRRLKKEYTIGSTDQPTSTMTIFMVQDTIKIKHYGLNGDTLFLNCTE